jgi:hypothetical protein
LFGSPDSVPGPPIVRPGYVLAGLTIATGPSGARFITGMTSFAHPELKVPISPIMLSLLAYARAFDVHFAESHEPACAVESSHDW